MKIKNVVMATNGMVICFDKEGQQMKDYHGFILDIPDKLKENCDETTNFSFGDWDNETRMNCNFRWWFKDNKEKKEK